MLDATAWCRASIKYRHGFGFAGARNRRPEVHQQLKCNVNTEDGRGLTTDCQPSANRTRGNASAHQR
eukprot:632170-Lingulodinium_polyedra.AAC.1